MGLIQAMLQMPLNASQSNFNEHWPLEVDIMDTQKLENHGQNKNKDLLRRLQSCSLLEGDGSLVKAADNQDLLKANYQIT